jgi:hypothetical protein
MQMSPRARIVLALLAGALCLWPMVRGADPALLIDRLGKGPSGPVQTIVGIVGLPLMLSYGFSFMIGSGTLGLMGWLRLRRETAAGSTLHPALLPLFSAVMVGIQALPFLTVPAGTHIRPMAWAAYVLVGAIALTVISVVQSISALKQGGKMPACVLALVLSLGIVVIPTLSLNAVAKIKGFSLGP